MFPDRAEDQLVLAAKGGVVVLALIVLYVFAPDLIAWTGAGYRRIAAKVKARRERILRERQGRRDGYITGDQEVQP